MTSNKDETVLADSYPLEVPRITAIEFPGNVINTSKAIGMLGSQNKVAKACVSRGDKQLELRFRPDDPYEHPIMSSTSKAQNIVLQIQLPKKNLDKAGGDIQKALSLSEKSDIILNPEYIIETTYRFRELGDYQYNTRGSKFIEKVKSTLFSHNYEEVKDFQFDQNESFNNKKDIDIIPPPRFSPLVYPFAYSYKQNPSLIAVNDGKGGQQLINRNKGPLLYAQYISWNDDPPLCASKELQKLNGEGPIACFNFLTQLFEERPIWTRKSIEYHLPKHLLIHLKQVLHYVSYTIQNGPWRDSVVKFGVDTRSSSDYRFYQTRRFRYNLHDKDAHKETRLPYKFDGKNKMSGSIVQFCDITDPDIRKLVDEGKVRETLDAESGWYESVDYHKIKLLLYLKYKAIGEGISLSEDQINEVMEMESDPSVAKLPTNKKANEEENDGKDTASQSTNNKEIIDLDSDVEMYSTDHSDKDIDEDISKTVPDAGTNWTETSEEIVSFSKENLQLLKDLSGFVLQKNSEKEISGRMSKLILNSSTQISQIHNTGEVSDRNQEDQEE